MKRSGESDEEIAKSATLSEPGGKAVAPERDPISTDDTLDPSAAAAPAQPVRSDGAAPAVADFAELPVVARESYQITDELRRGGMGRIFTARDRRLRRPVAIKELLDGSELALDRPRFEREARITARLQHPNIVSVYEAGRWPTGEPFFAMKLVTGGRSLGDVLAGAATLDERLALLPHLLAVADALAYAHEQRVIHRDLKPSNVLVGPFGETVVIDWGLGKDLAATGAGDAGDADGVEGEGVSDGAGGADEAPLTQAGALLGTPQYMSPEQAQRLPVDERTDVYAIGALLYHLLAGIPPYRGNDPLQIVAWVAREPPVPLGRLQPEVPAELLTIVDKAMAREPGDRYPTARELAADLRRFQTGQLVASHEYSRLSLVGRWVRPYLRTLTVVALSLAAVVVLLVGGARRLGQERARSDEERERAALLADEATVASARAAVGRDPSLALARLKTLPLESRRWGAARVIAADARERGVARLLHAGGGVRQLAFSADGAALALLGARGGVTLWGAERVVETRRLPQPSNALQLAVSPDGRWLATASEDRVLRIWPLGEELSAAPATAASATGPPSAAGAEAALLRGHRLPPSQILFSPDGRWLASTGPDRTLRLWDLAGEPSRAGGGRVIALGAASRIVFSSDGHALIAGGDDGAVTLWPLGGGAARHLGEGSSVRSLAVAASRLAAGGDDGSVRVWRLDGDSSGAVASRRHESAVSTLAFSPDGRTLAVGGDRDVRLWTLADDGRVESERVLGQHEEAVSQLLFSARGQLLASGSADGAVRLWDLAQSGAVEGRLLAGHVAPIAGLAFSPDGSRLASTDGLVARLWTVADRGRRVLALRPDGVQHLIVAPDGATIAVAGRARGFTVYEPGGATRLHVSDGSINQIAYSPDGACLATAEHEQRVRLWNLAAPSQPPQLLAGHAGPVLTVAFSPDGKQLVSGGHDHTTRLWAVDAQPATATLLDTLDDAVERVAFSRDGRLLVSSAPSGAARVLQLQRRERLNSLGFLRAVQLSPDGAQLAGGAEDGALRLLDVGSLDDRILGRHENLINALAWSPDGRRLASASRDRTVAVWSLPGGAERVLRGHTDWVTLVAFSPDGRTIASAAHDRSARLWDADSGEGRGLPGNADLLTWAPFFPDGRTVAVARAGDVLLHADDLPHDAALRAWLDQATNATLDAAGQLTP